LPALICDCRTEDVGTFELEVEHAADLNTQAQRAKSQWLDTQQSSKPKPQQSRGIRSPSGSRESLEPSSGSVEVSRELLTLTDDKSANDATPLVFQTQHFHNNHTRVLV
jgi:hypothetical protein